MFMFLLKLRNYQLVHPKVSEFIRFWIAAYLDVYSQVCVKDSNNIEVDSNVSLEIPSGTVIAYSVRELEINKDGSFGECVWGRACFVLCVSIGKEMSECVNLSVTSPFHVISHWLETLSSVRRKRHGSALHLKYRAWKMDEIADVFNR